MNMQQMMASIGADNDQDQAECDAWMRESSDREKMCVWMAIQRQYKDPVMELISRFAQLAFGQSLIRVRGDQSEDGVK